MAQKVYRREMSMIVSLALTSECYVCLISLNWSNTVGRSWYLLFAPSNYEGYLNDISFVSPVRLLELQWHWHCVLLFAMG